MKTVNQDLLSRSAELLLDGISTIPDFNLMGAALQRRKQLEVIQAALVRYHDAASTDVTTGDKIEDLIAGGWREEAFRKFWDAYDKKLQYAPTWKKWIKLKKEDIDKILENVEPFVAAHPEKQFRPNPLTYLNQRRWEDEIPTINKNARKVLPTSENTWNYDL